MITPIPASPCFHYQLQSYEIVQNQAKKAGIVIISNCTFKNTFFSASLHGKKNGQFCKTQKPNTDSTLIFLPFLFFFFDKFLYPASFSIKTIGVGISRSMREVARERNYSFFIVIVYLSLFLRSPDVLARTKYEIDIKSVYSVRNQKFCFKKLEPCVKQNTKD